MPPCRRFSNSVCALWPVSSHTLQNSSCSLTLPVLLSRITKVKASPGTMVDTHVDARDRLVCPAVQEKIKRKTTVTRSLIMHTAVAVYSKVNEVLPSVDHRFNYLRPFWHRGVSPGKRATTSLATTSIEILPQKAVNLPTCPKDVTNEKKNRKRRQAYEVTFLKTPIPLILSRSARFPLDPKEI